MQLATGEPEIPTSFHCLLKCSISFRNKNQKYGKEGGEQGRRGAKSDSR